MSLVDYASSSDEDDVVPEDRKWEERGGGGGGDEEEEKEKRKPQNEPNFATSPPTIPANNDHPSAPSAEKLPDASLLLNSPDILSVTGTDHASRVSAAMAENASRKRDSNVMPFALPRSKLPRGTLLHSKNVPDTVGGLLVPPQLSGRSNIVTEDMGKLFVRRQAEPSSH
uniref:Uncharacterized protein MANES_04G064100 n=1 Tax=Rhizophora mucronata TaxID=61149 RepID=A0A2P2QPV0_RHIMU